jgi:hypothetical protein
LAGYGHVIATQWQLFGGRNTQIVATFYDVCNIADGQSVVVRQQVPIEWGSEPFPVSPGNSSQ